MYVPQTSGQVFSVAVTPNGQTIVAGLAGAEDTVSAEVFNISGQHVHTLQTN